MLTLAYVVLGWLGFNLVVAALLVWRVIPPRQYRNNYQRIRLHAVPIPVTARRRLRRAL
jgi:hypothetical protein